MTSIATLGPAGSHSWQAARLYGPEAEIRTFPTIGAAVAAFDGGETDLAILPAYNTREGEIRDFLRAMEKLGRGYWIDNIVRPIQLSLGSLDETGDLSMLVGTGPELRQCEEYISARFPAVPRMSVQDIGRAMEEIKAGFHAYRGVIAPEAVLRQYGLVVRERETAPYNQTRFAVLGHEPAATTGYDATAILTAPLMDRVGLLYDILGEFSRRGVNLLDMRTESDIKTQKLQIYIEAEGHIRDQAFGSAIEAIDRQIIQEPGAIRVLGSFPRVDMRPKRIHGIGFIGTGDMSQWFASRLAGEGYKTVLTGRSTTPDPGAMIPEVDMVVVCVPISATSATVARYGPLLKDGQALVLLAGEAEKTLDTALAHTRPGVEVMLVHNLWGPKAATMKDKNVAVVRTNRSGILCSEFEAFLYKHGAEINQDSPTQHDLLMGVGQKLPTTISVALAMTLREHRIDHRDLRSHSTLTSLYSVLAMARVHTQNPRTYAEILATSGDSRKIVRSFAHHLLTVTEMAEKGDIDEICDLIRVNRDYLTPEFLEARMKQALAVDETLGRVIGG